MTAAQLPGGRATRQVGLIGYGSIGKVVAACLRAAGVEGHSLAAILDHHDTGAPEQVASIDDLVASSDVIVESAGHGALTDFGPQIREAGKDLLVVSVGALVDDELRRRLLAPGPGRVLLCSGAVGGFDALRAADRLAPLRTVVITTTKPSAVLAEPSWMSADLLDELRRCEKTLLVFEGSAREAASRFPRSVNVCATVALATVGLDETRVRVVADPDAQSVEHLIEAEGDAGSYRFSFRNSPSTENPRTSAITPYAILRALADQTAHVLVGG